MLSTHALAIEQLRYQERYRAHAWCLCRFCQCRVDVEDEVHVPLKCEARSAFRQDVTKMVGDVPWNSNDLLEQLIDLHRLTDRVAKYVYVVLELFSSVPMFIYSVTL
jgi:predicted ester cyclase